MVVDTSFQPGGINQGSVSTFSHRISLWGIRQKEFMRVGALLVLSLISYSIWYAFLIMIFRSSYMTLVPDLPSRLPFVGIRNLSDPISRGVVSIWVLVPGAVFGLWAMLDLWWKGEYRHMNGASLVALHAVLVAFFLPNWTWPDRIAIL